MLWNTIFLAVELGPGEVDLFYKFQAVFLSPYKLAYFSLLFLSSVRNSKLNTKIFKQILQKKYSTVICE